MSTYSSSLFSTAGLLKSMVRPRPKVSINLDKSSKESSATYTTSDRITGTVVITVDEETPFNNVSITFEGMSITANSPASSVATTSKAMHKFLHLRQPLSGNRHPNPRVFQPGQRYEYPFVFVVPQKLLPQACKHDTCSPSITQAHLQLPPSLEDTSPGDFRISYAVRAVVSKVSGKGTTKVLSNCTRKVRIVPSTEKQLLLDPVLDNMNICTRLEQDIKRGFEKHTKGHMVVEASPASPVLCQSASQKNTTNTTMIRVNLRFDPVHNASPPQPKEISAKLHTHTFYATIPWQDHPSWSDKLLLAGRAQSAFTKKTKLGSFGVAPLQWIKHTRDADGPHIEDSPSTFSRSSTSLTGGTYYTTSFVLPVSLPQSETQVPTFHSCLISRTYDLKIRIIHNTSKSDSHMSDAVVKVPLNVFYKGEGKQGVLSTLKEDDPDHVPYFFDSCDIKHSPPEYWV